MKLPLKLPPTCKSMLSCSKESLLSLEFALTFSSRSDSGMKPLKKQFVTSPPQYDMSSSLETMQEGHAVTSPTLISSVEHHQASAHSGIT
jgi:hypothetical protein